VIKDPAARRHYEKQRARIAAFKNHPCMDCRQMLPPECMDFDHVRGEKKFCIGHHRRYGDAELLNEIAKCDLVCSNCHRIRTRKRREGKS